MSSSSSNNPTPSEYVEIIFGKKNITREEAIEIIKEFTGNDDFEIVEFDDTDDGKRVIVKFKDVGKAKDFVNSVGGSVGEESIILNIKFVDEKDISLCPKIFIVPVFLLAAICFSLSF